MANECKNHAMDAPQSVRTGFWSKTGVHDRIDCGSSGSGQDRQLRLVILRMFGTENFSQHPALNLYNKVSYKAIL